MHDRSTGATERVNVDDAGNQANSFSGNPVISADGRFVAFASHATNLVRDDTNGAYDIFVHDRATKMTERMSVDSAGNQANHESLYPGMSADVRFVAFHSPASNLALGDTNDNYDVYVHDRATDMTELVSVNSDGDQGNIGSFNPAISADGHFVAFASTAINLIPSDTNGGRYLCPRPRSPYNRAGECQQRRCPSKF